MESFSLGITVLILIGIGLVIWIIYWFILPTIQQHRKVKININHERELTVEPGFSLLKTLADKNIYLPTSCGGNGICGLCQCKISQGGGEHTQIEVNVFTQEELADNWRLGCQVKVHKNLQIELPEEIFQIKQWECEVVSNKQVSTFIKEIVLRMPDNEMVNFKSGSFIQLSVPAVEVDFSKDVEVDAAFKPDWEKIGLLNLKMKNTEMKTKPYSMANPPADSTMVMLNVRLSTPPWNHKKQAFLDVNPGVCSSFIFSRKPGDKVNISGPFGNFHIKQTQREMMFIGGGAGMAPMRSHLFQLFRTEKTDRKTSFWYGGRSVKELFYQDDFETIANDFPNFTFHIALSEPKPEDNWNGYTGFIHQVILENYLKQHPEPQLIEYYICGPPLMLAAIVKMLANLGVADEMIAFDDFGS